MSYPYERCKGCPQCASPPETFISKSSGKVIRKVQHGRPKLVTSPIVPTTINGTTLVTPPVISVTINDTPNVSQADPRVLMLQLKDMERIRAAEAKKKATEEAAAERKRQKTKDAINEMSRELGIGIQLN